MPTFIINTYVNISTIFLNTQEIYNFIEEVEFDVFHREVTTESVNDSFATAFWEVDFNIEAEAFFGNKNSGIIVAFFENTKSSKVFVFMKFGAFSEASFVESVVDFARGMKIRS